MAQGGRQAGMGRLAAERPSGQGREPVPGKLEELAWQDGGMTTTEVLRGIGVKQQL